MIGFFKTDALVRGALCVLLACTATTGAVAHDVLAIFEAGGDNAMEAEFDTDTGVQQGSSHHLQSSASNLKFDAIGSMAFAPNDTLWGIIESGIGGAILAKFDAASGQRLSGGGALDSGGNPLNFAEVGATAFAPDGTFWSVFESGTGDAILGQFNPLTGQRKSGGGYLDNAGDIFSFSEIGAMTFAADGTLWGVLESGVEDAIIAHFNPLTGERLSGGWTLKRDGDTIAFDDVGAIGFSPDEGFWALTETGNGGASFDQFSMTTGEAMGVGAYLKVFNSTLQFKNVGAMAFRFAEPNAVPEPAMWAMMMFGFAMIGATLRTRRMVLA
jgi:hypothetical protein